MGDKQDSSIRINKVAGLFRACLIEEKFTLLLAIIFGLAFMVVFESFEALEGCNDEMCGLLILYGAALNVIFFPLLITIIMALVTRKAQKSIFVIILFLLIVCVAILLWTVVSVGVMYYLNQLGG